MRSKISQSIFAFIAVTLAVIFIGLTIKQTDFQVLKEAAARANYFWFLASMVLSIFSYWLRAKRWTFLLEPIGYQTKTKSGFWAISFAYFMNLTIPRSGEIARATSFYRMEKVPVDQSIGTIVLERVIDLLFLLLFFVLTFIFNADTLFYFFSFAQGISFGNYIITIGILILLLILSFTFRNKLLQIRIFRKIFEFLKGIWVGFLSILHLKKRGLFILYSVGIWTCYFFMTYLVIFAFPETSHFSVGEGFFLIVSGALGMILPAVGGLGYPYVMSMAFAAIYISSGQTAEEGQIVGNYFGLLLYFAQIISILIFGFLSMVYMGKLNRKKA